MPLPPPDAPVYTLDSLGSLATGATWLGVLGQPIKHSLSPRLHHAALAEMARENPLYSRWHYGRFEIAPADLPRALREFHARGFRGLNLTIPHKVLAVSEIARIDPAAQAAGAVNTLRWTPQGWEGFNTDGYGLSAGLKSDLGLSLEGAKIILLGAGGAARGAAIECLQRGCAELWIGNRTSANLETLLSVLEPRRGQTLLRGFDLGKISTPLPTNAWIINATSAGLNPADASPIDLAKVPHPAGVYDMIYRPPQTSLLAEAKKRGLPRANGLSMLIHQGARSLEIWTGEKVPVAAMEKAVKNLRGD